MVTTLGKISTSLPGLSNLIDSIDLLKIMIIIIFFLLLELVFMHRIHMFHGADSGKGESGWNKSCHSCPKTVLHFVVSSVDSGDPPSALLDLLMFVESQWWS